jgi:DNA helicase II / ATP-dependent DNA helicase PcrA
MLVLAGPGAGKTYCLIERIRFLIERRDFDPARICAFTFTNKAAEEIGARLARDLGPTGELVRRGTIHAFCTELLRRHGEHVRLGRGFGIADEEYQKSVLSRLRVSPRAQSWMLREFTLHRLRGQPLNERDTRTFGLYTRLLEQRNLVDFDALVVKARELLLHDGPAARETRARWDYVLVDEFQDLSPAQYAVLRELARDHGNLFAVGDDEQSIYSWAGADPAIFRTFARDFTLATTFSLTENRRCPRQTFTLARQLIQHNAPVFSAGRDIRPERDTPFPVRALSFATDADELAWLLADFTSDHAVSGLPWGEYALLYRRNVIGDALEAGLVSAGIPCRLAQGRALADDSVVRCVIASLRVILNPNDSINRDEYLRVMLPRSLCTTLQSEADREGIALSRHALVQANRLPRENEDGRRLRRVRAALRNLEALARKHTSLAAFVEELLSQPVGAYRSVLEKEERLKPLLDPAEDPEIVRLSHSLDEARRAGTSVAIAPMAGVGIALKGMLERLGYARVQVAGRWPSKRLRARLP